MAQNRLGTAAIDVIGKNAKFRKVINQNVKDVKKLSKTVKDQQKTFDRHAKSQKAMQAGMTKIAGLAATGLSLQVVITKVNELTTAAAEGAKNLNVMFNAANRAGDIGKTNAQLEKMVANIAKLGGATLNETRTAATKLLNIAENSKIAGDNIERTLRLAQDMASSGWGDLEGNIEEIAEVFALPKEAVAVLEKYNVFFNDAEKRRIDFLVDTNQELKAMEMIYDRMEAKFSGATAAANQGLQGALNRRNTALEQLNETLGTVIAEGLNLEDAFDALAGTMNKFRLWLDRTFLGGQQEFSGSTRSQLRHQLAVAQRDMRMLPPAQDVDPGSAEHFDTFVDSDLEQERGRLQARINAIQQAIATLDKADADAAWNKSLKAKDDHLAQINKTTNATVENTRVVIGNTGAVYANAEAEKAAAKAAEDAQKVMTRHYQLFADTRMEADNQVALNAEKHLTNMIRQYQLFAETRIQADADEVRRMANIYGEYGETRTASDDQAFSDKQRAEREAERLRAREAAEETRRQAREAEAAAARVREYSEDVAYGLSSMTQSLIQFQMQGEFSLKALRTEGLSVAADIAQKFADRAIWEPFENMMTNLFDGIVKGIGSGQGLSDAFSSAWAGLSGSKAMGGRVQGGRGYRVHDGEMFVPDKSGYVYSKADVRNMGSGGRQVIFSPTINSNDPEAVEAKLRGMMPEFAQFAKEQITYDRSRPGKVASAFGG